MNDKYARAVKYLKAHPWEIPQFWVNASPDGPGCLFQLARRNGKRITKNGQFIGCLTQIRFGGWNAQTKKLTLDISADERIPDSVYRITPDNLHVFAQWQRRLDKELRKKA